MSYITKTGIDTTTTSQQSPENGALQTYVVNTGTAATPRAMSRSPWFAHNDILFSILQYLEGTVFKELRLVCREAQQIFSIRSWNNPCNKLFHQKFEVKILSRLLFEYSDAFYYIVPYLDYLDCQELREVCKEASKIPHILERFLVKMNVDNLMNSDKKGKAKLDFASQYGLNFLLELYLYSIDKDFETFQRRLLLSKVIASLLPEDTFIQKAQKIVLLKVYDTDAPEELDRLKQLLKTISNCQDILINLKKLHNPFANLEGLKIPNSVEFFKCQFPKGIINICDFKNLKTIEFGCIQDENCTFKIERLSNLESITIENLKINFCSFNIASLPKLKSIKVNGKEVPFERKAEGTDNYIRIENRIENENFWLPDNIQQMVGDPLQIEMNNFYMRLIRRFEDNFKY